MTPSELLTVLRDNLNTRTTLKPVKRPPQRPRRDKSYTHNFYDVSHLALLTEELLKLGDYYDYDEKYGVRYLVETNGRIVFAREGRPGKFIPGHKQISSRCLVAGNIYFNADYSKVVKINHESGDFHPGIETLVHALTALLTTMPRLINNTLEVEVRGTPSSKTEVIELNKSALIKCLSANFRQARLSNSPWESIKTDSFIDSSSTAFRRKSQVDALHRKKPRFSDLLSAPELTVPQSNSFVQKPLQSNFLFFSSAPQTRSFQQRRLGEPTPTPAILPSLLDSGLIALVDERKQADTATTQSHSLSKSTPPLEADEHPVRKQLFM